MMDANTFNAQLWQDETSSTSSQVYALLDGARDARIVQMVYGSGQDYACLYTGKLSLQLQAAAPYLVHLSPGSRFTRELFRHGWGRSWGVFAVAPPEVTLDALRRHFRTLLRVRDELGRNLVFRFYDPRVLRIYLPTCTAAETKTVYGPTTAFLVEDERAAGLTRYPR